MFVPICWVSSEFISVSIVYKAAAFSPKIKVVYTRQEVVCLWETPRRQSPPGNWEATRKSHRPPSPITGQKVTVRYFPWKKNNSTLLCFYFCWNSGIIFLPGIGLGGPPRGWGPPGMVGARGLPRERSVPVPVLCIPLLYLFPFISPFVVVRGTWAVFSRHSAGFALFQYPSLPENGLI